MSEKQKNEKKISGFDVYCAFVSVFSKMRIRSLKKRKSIGKYNVKTGLIRLAKVQKIKKAKRNKAYKPKNKKR